MSTLTTALMAAVAPQMAQASTPSPQSGVHVDPGSPAGKEYQFPVTGARGETAGGAQQSGSASPPLFGVGVTPTTPAAGSTPRASPKSAQMSPNPNHARSGAAGTGTNPSASSRSGSGAQGAGSASSRGGAGSVSAEASPAAAGAGSGATGSGGAGGNGWIPLAVGGLLVLVLGGGSGLMLRQRVLRG